MRRALAAALSLVVALPAPAGDLTFADVTRKAGIDFRFKTDLKRGRMIATMGGGVAMGDYDGDGWLDLFFTGSARHGRKPEKGPCGVLYRNRGDGTFEDTTRRAGVRSCGWTMGASFVDVDSDGRLDLVVTGLGATELHRNRGDGTFVEESAARGLVATRYAIGLAAGDPNGDGRVDLYVVNYLDTSYEREHAFPQFHVRLPEDYAGQDAALFLQQADGSFRETAAAAGALNRDGKGLAAVFFDYDGDADADLYVTNDRVPNVLYRGRGDGTFEDVTVETGAGAREMKPRAGMGIAVGDPDADGRPDIAVTNFGGEPISVYRNLEGQLFDDASEAWGVARGSLPYVQWGTDFADLDDDGWPDLVAVSGHLVPRILLFFARLFRKEWKDGYGQGDQRYRQPPVVFRNLGEGRFEDVTARSLDLAGLRLSARGLAAGDVDGDGRVDVAIAAIAGGVRLLKGTSAPQGQALEVLPVAGADGRTVLGTRVAVTAGGRSQVQEFVLRPSYASGSWVPLHFGLGEAKTARVEVTPPGATSPSRVFEDVPAGSLYELRDGALRAVRAFSGRP